MRPTPKAWIPLLIIALLLAGVGVGLVRTRDGGGAVPGLPQNPRRAVRAKGRDKAKEKAKVKEEKDKAPIVTMQDLAVDDSHLALARDLRGLATTQEEQAFVRQAERLANHEVDLAFADALRLAANRPIDLTPEQEEVRDYKLECEDVVEDSRRRVEELNRLLAKAPEGTRAPLEDQLEVAKAQLELDQDELESVSEDLERIGADPQARLAKVRQALDAADKAAAAEALPSTDAPPRTLWTLLRGWLKGRTKVRALEAAERLALTRAGELDVRRAALAKEIEEGWDQRRTARRQAQGFARDKAALDREASKTARRVALANLRRHQDDQRVLTDLGRRGEDLRGLGALYGAWGDLAEQQGRLAVHLALWRALWILSLVFVVFLAGRLVDQRLKTRDADERAGATGLVVMVVLRFVAAVAILLIAIGLPAQPGTVLGLAGAGLTVALKDFILAFLGWFALMGRNGLRVGDWVEIKGVTGEVVEIGLVRTVLLETGSWSDASHPTGRRVAFVNSFAVEGHYFNFSTSAQWMWDELRAVIPSGQDPAPVLKGIQELVESQTRSNAEQAEGEWQKATKRYRVRAFSMVPGLHVAPVAGGIEVRVRYVSRAHERDATRQRLNQAVVDLLHGGAGQEGPKAERE